MDIRLIWLAVGTFAIGVESFAISSLLPQIAESTGVSLTQAGYLVLVFSLANAFGSPILAALTGTADRRLTLTITALIFSAGAVWAGFSQGYADLMAARILMAFAAGLYTATAQATGVAISSVDHRARAISVIVGGTTMAVAFGAPLGALVAGLVTWRGTYFMVAGFGVIAAMSIWIMLPSGLRGAPLTLRQRIKAVALPGVPGALLTTLFNLAGAFTVIVYLAVVTTQSIGLPRELVPAVLLAFGIGAAFGNVAGGQLADRIGARPTVIGAASLNAILLVAISLAAHLPTGVVIPAFFVLIVIWGGTGWAFPPAQSSYLLSRSHGNAPLVLSLNSSALYLGIASGAVIGGLVLQYGTASDLGWVGAIFPALSLVGIGLSALLREPDTSLVRQG
ncbi:MFS transporter [Devosia psychrophila]|uniref:MFS transporter n=1 Tax=Devosia psychrophila TaxID=728005 RepID=A0A0F5PRQ0_9HYPH|nr:MFS transporter [Devosia psychrophila]KKC31275.1 MFS transporter [Devosia psychrophila]SFC91617.1 Predicted arabinose efflux permease, MFS family [Devosia psychrophila]